MNALDRYRRIWLYLPEDYHQSNENYPVLYMQDGQNLFDVKTAFAGEWKVDEALDSMIKEGFPPIIVVGIDNGGSARIAEYTPWPNPQYGGGHARQYVRFIVEELKPYIDRHYRTKPEAKFTGIGGSSLGGLVSIYAGLSHPETFGKILAFSNSFWFSDSVYLIREYMPQFLDTKPDVYMVAGELEGAQQVINMFRFRDTLLRQGWLVEEVQALGHADGRHNEAYWAREFPAACEWLFGRFGSSVKVFSSQEWDFKIFQDRDQITLSFIGEREHLTGFKVELLDMHGRRIWQTDMKDTSVVFNSGHFMSGIYFVKITDKDGRTKVKKLMICR